jgi:hypothetical protein
MERARFLTVFDGLDMAPVLFGGSDTHHTDLYHPGTVAGATFHSHAITLQNFLSVQRYKQYKIFSMIGSSGCCTQHNMSQCPVDEQDCCSFVPTDSDEATALAASVADGGMTRLVEVGPAPLVFDLSEDPAEAAPIPVGQLPPGLLDAARALQVAKNDSIFGTFRSVVDYTNGRGSVAGPCCNDHEPGCRCHARQTSGGER